jgi:hypothetical protein
LWSGLEERALLLTEEIVRFPPLHQVEVGLETLDHRRVLLVDQAEGLEEEMVFRLAV